MQVAQDTVVALEVHLSDVHGNLIQQSAEAVQYLHGGYEGIFPLVEDALQGREPGEKIEVHLEPEDAFGEYDAELVRLAERTQFPEELQVGMQFEQESGAGDDELLIFTVTDVAEDKVVLDGNHPLAGMALRFCCTVTAVRAATPEEIERGYADDATGPLITVMQ